MRVGPPGDLMNHELAADDVCDFVLIGTSAVTAYAHRAKFFPPVRLQPMSPWEYYCCVRRYADVRDGGNGPVRAGRRGVHVVGGVLCPPSHLRPALTWL